MKDAFKFLLGAATATCWIGSFEWTRYLIPPVIVLTFFMILFIGIYISDHWHD